MSVHVFIGVVLTHWLLTIAACVLVFFWSVSRRRFWPCIIFAFLAFLSSYYGVTRISIVSSQTVNGHLQYRIDSKWFFTASLMLSLLALAYTLWKRWRAPYVAQPACSSGRADCASGDNYASGAARHSAGVLGCYAFMRTTFTIIVSGLLLVACSQKQATPSASGSSPDSFVAQLDAQGYFRGLAPEKVQALKADFRQKGWMAIFRESHRYYHADAADLAKGGVCAFVRETQPFLSVQGVKIPDLRDEVSQSGYVVRVGGVPHKMYDAAELKRDTGGKEPGLIWGLATVRGFALVDQMLESAGSPERVYAIEGGNDLSALFLTPDLYRTIAAQPGFDAKGGPYKVTEQYPAFGQPQK
jgi:hypothetical protein